MGRSEGHLGGRICVGGEGAVRVLQGFGALRPQEATQREELQSPSGPLSLEGLWGEDRLPAGVGAAFPKPVSAGLHVPKEGRDWDTVLGARPLRRFCFGSCQHGQGVCSAQLIVYPAKC